ncbi:hypothetical protein [Streptomyces sp. NPDC048269]|uniref:hypothetical protein n=1 Tax=Streptomyces sp. NPDC048269 TaxID=3155753 RepID=UPI0034439C1D
MDVGGRASVAVAGELSLIDAVRTGDMALVKRLLQEDDDYDKRTAAFGVAVQAFSGGIAQLLLERGADPSQCGPDELLSLREAIDSGSPALVAALLDYRIRGGYAESELLEMRDLARRWYEAGVEAELRRRTGSQDDLVRTRVQDDEYYGVGEPTLGGLSVRDGHGAILTDLEELLAISSSFEELMARALDHDQDHAAWGRASILLAHRRDQETWTAAASLRTHPDPSHRLFGADLVRLIDLFDDSEEEAFAGPTLDILVDWSAEERDLAVLTMVLCGLGGHAGPRAEAPSWPTPATPMPVCGAWWRRGSAHGPSSPPSPMMSLRRCSC